MSLVVGCRRCADDSARPAPAPRPDDRVATPTSPPAPGAWRALTWSADDVPPEGEAALVRRGDGDDGPVIIALHGRGESERGLLAGAAGFRDDYAIEKVEAKLLAGTVSAADLGGFATADRVTALCRSLAAAPYRRPTLVTPYCPALRDRSTAGAEPFATFVCDALAKGVDAVIGGPIVRERRGIDGISMGGRLALQVAILRPEAFASVGAMQPALSLDEVGEIARALATARERSPFMLRLVSSNDDPFLEAVRGLDAALSRLAVPHGFIVTPGPHDYAWNRGPGAAELLMFHERGLRGMTPP